LEDNLANFILKANTVSPRPPLNIFEASRAAVANTQWVTLAEVPQYYIPAVGPTPARTVNTVAIMTGLTITNNHDSTIRVSARIVDQDQTTFYPILNQAIVPPNDFLSISFERQVMMTWEKLQVSVPSNTTANNRATAHFTYIINQREEFELTASNPRT
jgi:hypothetical protein